VAFSIPERVLRGNGGLRNNNRRIEIREEPRAREVGQIVVDVHHVCGAAIPIQ
jgi:hypothetical protein